MTEAPIANVTKPTIRAIKMSKPAPFPEENMRIKILANKGPPTPTIIKLIKNTQSQNKSKSRHSGITAKTYPLIQGTALNNGLAI